MADSAAPRVEPAASFGGAIITIGKVPRRTCESCSPIPGASPCAWRKSRPGRGLVRTRVSVKKEDGTTALVYTPLRMVRCRDTA